MLIRTLTWDELYTEVAKAQQGLIDFGVKPGDRVAAITSNNAGEQRLPHCTKPV
jgi:acetoacetyl-CoA synthetase